MEQQCILEKSGNKIFYTAGNVGIGISSPAYKLDVAGDINLDSGNVLRIGGVKILYDVPTSGNNNVFLGDYADTASSPGFRSTAVGSYALSKNTAAWNTAVGSTSLQNNTTGSSNTAVGEKAMQSNTSGYTNSAFGSGAMQSTTTGYDNTASGFQSLYKNVTGFQNTAIGFQSSYNTTGYDNTAAGFYSLFSNTSGNNNTAIGDYSMYNFNGGYQNTGVGMNVLYSMISGTNITAVGFSAGVASDGLNDATAIGVGSRVDANDKVVIGSASVKSIGGNVGWTTFSDGRYKRNIQTNVPGLEFINKLNPVTYTLDVNAIESKLYANDKNLKTADGKIISNLMDDPKMQQALQEKSQIIYTGFIAQDVEKAAASLNYNFSGVDKPKDDQQSFYGLRYGDFVVPLVKALQELSAENDSLQNENAVQQSAITILQSAVLNLQKEIDELHATGLNSSAVISQDAALNTNAATLAQNTPNPYNQSTIIRYTLPQKFSSAQIIITDNSGKTNKQINLSGSGKGVVNINAGWLVSGTYQYSLLIDGKLIDTKKMIIEK